MTEIPTFFYIGVDFKDRHDIVQVARTRLIDIVNWTKEDATFRRFFPVEINRTNPPLFSAAHNGTEPVQAGSVRSPVAPQ